VPVAPVVAALWPAGPERFWPGVPRGQNRSGPVAHRADRGGPMCHEARISRWRTGAGPSRVERTCTM
jgi:hypothetical protein